MKKRFLAFFILIAILCTFLIGCNLFKTNVEKDLQRIIALVGDKDVHQDEIKKYELVNYYDAANSQSSEQQTATQSMKDLFKQMIYRRVTIQKAVTYLIAEFYSEKNSTISDYYIENGFTYYKILGRSDEDYNKDNINTDEEYKNYSYEKRTIDVKDNMTLKDVLAPAEDEPDTSEILMVLLRVHYGDLESVVDRLEEIENSLTITDEFKKYYQTIKDCDVFSDHLIISSFNNVWASEKSTLDQIENQLRADRGLDPIEAEQPTTTKKRPVPTEDKDSSFVLPEANAKIDFQDIGALRTEAFSKYSKQISRNFFGMEYDEFFEGQLVSELELRALERHQELYTENEIEIEPNEFEKRFNAIKNSEKQGFDLNLNDYKTKLESAGDDTFILYNPVDGVYGYVKHILLGVDTDLNRSLKRKLDILKTRELTRSSYLTERTEIFKDIKVKDLREDPTLDVFDDYVDYFSETAPVSLINFYTKFKEIFSGSGSGGLTGVYNSSTFGDVEEALEEFEKWIFMYNNDDGIFNNELGYLITEKGSMGTEMPVGGAGTYAVEFAEASRELIKAGEGSYTLVATDFGYHIIICSEIITAGEEVFNRALFDKIVAGNEDEADKKTATYKLYQLIKKEYGPVQYENLSIDAVNKYYYDGFVEQFTDRFQDLLKL